MKKHHHEVLVAVNRLKVNQIHLSHFIRQTVPGEWATKIKPYGKKTGLLECASKECKEHLVIHIGDINDIAGAVYKSAIKAQWYTHELKAVCETCAIAAISAQETKELFPLSGDKLREAIDEIDKLLKTKPVE